jgi:hypothetical protein
MIDRSERRALAARGDVRAAEVVDHVDTEPCGEARAVAQLAGAALVRAMPQRVAMEADYIDPAPWRRQPGQKRLYHRRMSIGQVSGQRLQIVDRTLRSTHGPIEARAQCGRIRRGHRRPDPADARAVRFDRGDVDAVHRRAAHQPDRAVGPGHAAVPFAPVYRIRARDATSARA